MRRAPQNRRFGAPRRPPEEPPRSADPFAFLFGRDMWLGGGVAALGAVCVANYYADQADARNDAEEEAREAERRDAIRKQREARRRELDAPARLAFKRRQLAHSQQAGDAARVAELRRREIAALEPGFSVVNHKHIRSSKKLLVVRRRGDGVERRTSTTKTHQPDVDRRTEHCSWPFPSSGSSMPGSESG